MDGIGLGVPGKCLLKPHGELLCMTRVSCNGGVECLQQPMPEMRTALYDRLIKYLLRVDLPVRYLAIPMLLFMEER